MIAAPPKRARAVLVSPDTSGNLNRVFSWTAEVIKNTDPPPRWSIGFTQLEDAWPNAGTPMMFLFDLAHSLALLVGDFVLVAAVKSVTAIGRAINVVVGRVGHDNSDIHRIARMDLGFGRAERNCERCSLRVGHNGSPKHCKCNVYSHKHSQIPSL